MSKFLYSAVYRVLPISFLYVSLISCGDRPGVDVDAPETTGGSSSIPPLDPTKPDLQLALIIRMDGDLLTQFLQFQQTGASAIRVDTTTAFKYDPDGRLESREKRFYEGGTSPDLIDDNGEITERDRFSYSASDPDTRKNIEHLMYQSYEVIRRVSSEETWENNKLINAVESIYSANGSLVDILDSTWAHYSSGNPSSKKTQSRFQPENALQLAYQYNSSGQLSTVNTGQGSGKAEYRYNAQGDWTEVSLYNQSGRLERCISSETGWINGLGLRIVIEWAADGDTSCTTIINSESVPRSIESHIYGLSNCHSVNKMAQVYLAPDKHLCTPRSRWSNTVFN